MKQTMKKDLIKWKSNSCKKASFRISYNQGRYNNNKCKIITFDLLLPEDIFQAIINNDRLDLTGLCHLLFYLKFVFILFRHLYILLLLRSNKKFH